MGAGIARRDPPVSGLPPRNLNVEPSADIAETTRMTRQEHCRLQATDPFRNADAS